MLGGINGWVTYMYTQLLEVGEEACNAAAPKLWSLTHLFVRIDIDVAFDTLLAHVGPAVARHPLSLTLGALVLPETTLLALVGSQTFSFGPRLQIHRTTTTYR